MFGPLGPRATVSTITPAVSSVFLTFLDVFAATSGPMATSWEGAAEVWARDQAVGVVQVGVETALFNDTYDLTGYELTVLPLCSVRGPWNAPTNAKRGGGPNNDLELVSSEVGLPILPGGSSRHPPWPSLTPVYENWIEAMDIAGCVPTSLRDVLVA